MNKPKITLQNVYISHTYGGCLEGKPPNECIIDEAKEQAIKLYGKNRPTYIIEPTTERLFPYQYIAWFDCLYPIKDGEAHGSHLVLIWWDKEQTLNNVADFASMYWKYADDYYM